MPRKIDDNKLLEMLKQGKLQKEIAQHFGVSPVAVCKRLKRLLPPPKSLEDLTDKEKRFVLAVIGGKTATQAALNSFDVSSMNSAKAMGSQLMGKPGIRMAISELMELKGIGREYRIEKLGEHVRNHDPVISLKALDMACKLGGDEADARNQEKTVIPLTIDLSKYQD